jgi:hypothetical protein
MATFTTVKVSTETRDTINRYAAELNVSADQLLQQLLNEQAEALIWRKVRASWAKVSPEDMASYRDEFHEWSDLAGKNFVERHPD